MSRALAVTVYALTAALFGFFFILPIVQTLAGAFVLNGQLTLAFVAEVFRNPLYVEGLRNAFFLGLFGTLAALAIAMPLAWLSDRFEFPGKKIFSALVLAPLILPPFVGAIGIKKIFGQLGSLNAALMDIGWLHEPIDWLGRGRFWGCVALV